MPDKTFTVTVNADYVSVERLNVTLKVAFDGAGDQKQYHQRNEMNLHPKNIILVIFTVTSIEDVSGPSETVIYTEDKPNSPFAGRPLIILQVQTFC